MKRPRSILATTAGACLLIARAAFAGIELTGGDPVSVAPAPAYALAGDFTNDGLTDLVVVSPASREVGVYVAAPDTPSRFAATQQLHFGDELLVPALGDLDADGRLDLVVPNGRGNLVWIALGKGDGTFADPYEITLPGARWPSAVAIGNFDDSGHPDLAVADQRLGRVFILRNRDATPPCFAESTAALAVDPEPTRISSADLNGDGKPDLITLNVDRPRARVVSVALWKRVVGGEPEFGATATYPAGARADEMLLADFNGDGRPDIATIGQSGEVSRGEIALLINDGTGVFSVAPPVDVPCPFFTGGAPCRLLALTGGDISGDGVVDLVVGLSDPRRSGSSAASIQDAMQVFAGRGDGRFLWGPVFATQKSPVAMVTGMLTGSGRVDVAVVAERPPTLQAFANLSSPGYRLNGDECLLGDECLSSHCVNGVCCATQCGLDEQCKIPGREGTCHPGFGDPTECTGSGESECDPAESCVDGFCCDQPCEGGRCDVDGLLGVCILGVLDGQPCSDDGDCTSRFCGDNFVCCREACEGGFCDSEGLSHPLAAQGEPCGEDAECASDICDVFDAICCDRHCDPATEGCPNGTCGRLPDISPLPAPGPPARDAFALSPAVNPCTSCPNGTQRENGLCVAATGEDDGCSIDAGHGSDSAILAVALLPMGLWIARHRHCPAAPPAATARRPPG